MVAILDSNRDILNNVLLVQKKLKQTKPKWFTLLLKLLIICLMTVAICDIHESSYFGVASQRIDCTSGFLCDFFSRFPHLPFSRLHPKNSGYIRTLDYMISQDADVIPSQYSPATAKKYENYYQTELSEMRKSPIPKFPAVQSDIARKYEPKVNILSKSRFCNIIY